MTQVPYLTETCNTQGMTAYALTYAFAVTLLVNGAVAAEGRIERTVPVLLTPDVYHL